MPQRLSGEVRGTPRLLLRLEGAAVFSALVAAYDRGGHPWWWFAALFLVPDLSMLAYLAGPRLGAAAYNAVHNLVGPVLLGAAGFVLRHSLLPWLAVIWAAHIEFDRMLGFGLKYPSRFGHTHLGFGYGEGEAPPDHRPRLIPRFVRPHRE